MIALSPLPSFVPSPQLNMDTQRRVGGGPVRRLSSSGFCSSAGLSASVVCSHSKRSRTQHCEQPRLPIESGIGQEDTIPTTLTGATISPDDHGIERELTSSYILVGDDFATQTSIKSNASPLVVRKRRERGRNSERTPFDSPLHRPKNAKHLLQLLESGYDPNQRDSTHDHSYPIHSIVRSQLKDRAKCLEALLVHGAGVDVNSTDAHKMTPLHFAAMSGDLRCIKLLLAFGANINAISDFDLTPMNLAIAHYREPAIQLFSLLGGVSAAFVMETKLHPLPPITHFHGFRLQLSSLSGSDQEEDIERGCDIMMESDRQSDPRLQIQARVQSSFTINEEEAVSLILQQQETTLLHQEEQSIMHSLTHSMHNGSRILSLDGMGTRGLILLETLEQLVAVTGQPITEMFDIICGTSIGGLIALGLVYGKRSLSQLRQSIYRLKESVYGDPHTSGISDERLVMILRDLIGDENQAMCDVKEPKVIVFAVNKETTDLRLQAFNNCFDDGLSHESVLSVAHYSILSPTFLHNTTQYVSASLLANNPCDYALTRLQQHYFSRNEQCPVSLVVSVGTGVYTHDNTGAFPRLSLFKTKSRTADRRLQNFLVLLRNSLTQSEEVSRKCSYRCEQLSIPYYRFSPELKQKVSVFETETRLLLNAVLRTRIELQNVQSRFDDLKDYMFRLCKLYTASGSGLGGAIIPSDVISPSELVPRPISSDTTSSGEELQKLHFLRRYRRQSPPS